MSLTLQEKAALSTIEASMARKGFDLGEILDQSLGNPAPAADVGDGLDLVATEELEEIVSAGVETRVLLAPAVGYTGLKIIRFKTDGGNVTILADNVLGFTVENFTLANVEETIVLVANGAAKWVQIGGNVTPA